MKNKPNRDQVMVYLAYAWMVVILVASCFYKALNTLEGWNGVANASMFCCLLYTLWKPTPFTARWRRMGRRCTP